MSFIPPISSVATNRELFNFTKDAPKKLSFFLKESKPINITPKTPTAKNASQGLTKTELKTLKLKQN